VLISGVILSRNEPMLKPASAAGSELSGLSGPRPSDSSASIASARRWNC